MKKRRLTEQGHALVKKIIFVLVLIALIAVAVFAIKSNKLNIKLPWDKAETTESLSKDDNTEKKETKATSENKVKETTASIEKSASDKNATFNLAVEPWSGWFAAAAANGSRQTTPDSIFGQSGIDVNIIVEEDDAIKLTALINGDIDALGTTVNRLAVMSKEISDNNLEVIVPFFTDYSSGGDGIVANSKYTSIESLKNAKIGLSKESVSHVMLGYLIKQSGLTDEEQKQVMNDVFTYDGTDAAYEAYFRGEVDVLATWEPSLSKALNYTDSTLLFSTKTTSKLVSDCIVVRKDYADAHPEVLNAFIDGCLQVAEDLKTGTNKLEYYDNFDNVFPEYESTEESLDVDLANATLMDWSSNKNSFDETAKYIFSTMCEVWEDIGKETVPEMAETIFDSSFIDSLASKYENLGNINDSTIVVNDENRDDLIQTDALLNKSVRVNFKANTCYFMDNAEAAAILDEFIATAKILDGTIIQIEGNVASEQSSEYDYTLSLLRAETIEEYFISQGIDARRMITIGNGGDKKIANNYEADGVTLSKSGTDANRRTDIMFKQFELE
jgi:ABC-type nitrate/sulfonate/bicarbonate transport system substrate-binding protein